MHGGGPAPHVPKLSAAYSQRYSKAIPAKVDEVIAVPAPKHCSCGGELEIERIESQYQQEILRQTIWRRFDIPILSGVVRGAANGCTGAIRGRPPMPLEATAVQLGPEALSLGVEMNKGIGVPQADVAAVLTSQGLRP